MDVNTCEYIIFMGRNEKNILKEFIDFLLPDDTLIGYNIKNFDLPFLKARFIVNRVPSLKFASPPLRIIDVSEFLHHGIFKAFNSNGKLNRYYKLDDFARLLGIKGEFELVGALVKKWYEENRFDLIDKHLKDDLYKTYVLYQILDDHFHLYAGL